MKVPKSLKTQREFETWLSFVQDRANPAHGTVAGYNKHRCRCKRCRKANSDQYNEKVRLNYLKQGIDPWWRQ